MITALHTRAPLLKGDDPWVASGATPQIMMETPAAFFLHDVTFHMAKIDKPSTSSWPRMEILSMLFTLRQ